MPAIDSGDFRSAAHELRRVKEVSCPPVTHINPSTETEWLTKNEQHRVKYRGVNMNLIGNPKSVIPGFETKETWTFTNKSVTSHAPSLPYHRTDMSSQAPNASPPTPSLPLLHLQILPGQEIAVPQGNPTHGCGMHCKRVFGHRPQDSSAHTKPRGRLPE